jgi:hypothetical protein
MVLDLKEIDAYRGGFVVGGVGEDCLVFGEWKGHRKSNEKKK